VVGVFEGFIVAFVLAFLGWIFGGWFSHE